MGLRYSYQRIPAISLNSEIVNKRYPIAGQRITHNEGTAKVSIKFDSNTNDAIDLSPQGSIVAPDGFKTFFLSADASAGNEIELVVSSPASFIIENKSLTVDTVDAITNILNLENVDLIDRMTLLDEITNILNVESIDLIDAIAEIRKFPARYNLDQGNAYFGGVSVAGVASQYSHAVLFNPSGSGKTLKVNRVCSGNNSSGGRVGLRKLTGTTGLSKASDGFNCNLSLGQDGVGDIYSGTNVAILGTEIQNDLYSNTQYASYELIKDIISLPENTCLIASTYSVNIVLSVAFEWIEE